MGAQEHAPLIACAKHSYTKRIAHALPVTEVERAEASTCGQPCGQRAGQKISPRDVDHVGKILLADYLLGFCQVHQITSWIVSGCNSLIS